MRTALMVALAVASAHQGVASDVDGQPPQIKIESSVPYRQSKVCELLSRSNLLDVYRPEDSLDCPVVLLIHGGAWIAGDKSLDFIPLIARKLARDGFVVVAANYRLSPLVQHPTHTQDVAQALAWTVSNIGRFGGRPDKIFLVGHSAGGHIVSLLATNPEYLRDVKVDASVLRGVVSISGVYEISSLTAQGLIGDRTSTSALATATSPFALAFGADPQVWSAASPIRHVRPGLPPFLILSSACDLPMLADMAAEFDEALRQSGNSSRLIEAPWRTHATGFWRMAVADDPIYKSLQDFLQANSH